MEKTITANDLKTRGVTAIDMVVKESGEAIVSVRGKNTYVIMPIEKYNYYRECELEAAISETQKEIKEGKYISEAVDEHIKRITDA